MSKLFNAQNLSGFKWKDFLIYFTGVTGSYVIYRYDTTSGRYDKAKSASELLKAENIYVSYSYLGGIHISNYSMTKEVNGNETKFIFELGKISTQAPGAYGQFWDIPNAAFLRQSIGSYSRVSPVKLFTITLVGSNPSSVFRTDFTTFDDISGRNCTVDFGVIASSQFEGENFLSIRDLNQDVVLWQGFNAVDNVITDGCSPNPIYQAYRGGVYLEGDSTKYSFTIHPNPTDATVYINGERTSSVNVPHGTQVQWSVEKEGYITQEGSYTVMADYTMNIELIANPDSSESVESSNDESVALNTSRAIARSLSSENDPIDITGYAFYQSIALIAAFFGFVQIGNAWYKRVYLVSFSSEAFNISQMGNSAYAAMVEGISDTDIDYSGFMDMSFTYYQLNSNM